MAAVAGRMIRMARIAVAEWWQLGLAGWLFMVIAIKRLDGLLDC